MGKCGSFFSSDAYGTQDVMQVLRLTFATSECGEVLAYIVQVSEVKFILIL